MRFDEDTGKEDDFLGQAGKAPLVGFFRIKVQDPGSPVGCKDIMARVIGRKDHEVW